MGTPKDPEKRKLWIERIRRTLTGRHHSEASKEKMRGREISIETRIKLGRIQGEKHHNFGKHLSKETRKKMGESRKGNKNRLGKPTSQETKRKQSKAHRGKFTGEKNPSWKGGITPVARSIRNSVVYELWRKAVFIRDHFQCQDCGKIGYYLVAHHSYSFAQLLKDYNIVSLGQAFRVKELWDINNGLTLCKKCHGIRNKREAVNARKTNFDRPDDCEERSKSLFEKSS